MATKKKTTKKPTKSTVNKPKKFDLSIKDDKQSLEIIMAFQTLEVNAGWMLLRQIFEGNMAVLQDAILRKRDPNTDAALSEEECDRLRDRFAYLEEIINTPQKYIQKLGQKSPEMPNYDPYDAIPSKPDTAP